MRPERWLQVAGYGTWLVTGLPTLAAILSGQLDPSRATLWIAAFGVFGGAFAACTWPTAAPRPRPRVLALLAAQTLASLTMVASGDDLLVAATLVVVCGQLLPALPPVGAGLWAAAQTAAAVLLFAQRMPPGPALSLGGAFCGFEVFALAMGMLAAAERRAREALARTNSDLQATRAQLVGESRLAERVRISRDLHDTLGHHLTALSLQLDVASRVAEGKAAEHVQRAHAITRLLLSDVRDVVSSLREGGPVDVSAEIRALASGYPSLAIHLDVPPALHLHDEPRARALVRSVQEVITNAARHSGAANLWVSVRSGPDGLELDARDDGHGATAVRHGHGLTGMRERFEACGGRVEFVTAPARGFEVHGFLPSAEPAS